MNPSFLGDSYDLVKRFFVQELRSLGYEVAVDPFFTGDWVGKDSEFYRLIGAERPQDLQPSATRTALLLDPDTGVNELGGKQHASYRRVATEILNYGLVFAFDQSFSRQANASEVIQQKLLALKALGVCCMYYDSHARFLFASANVSAIEELRSHFLAIGMPASRLVS